MKISNSQKGQKDFNTKLAKLSKMQSNNSKWIFLLTLFLVCFGALMVYSASFYSASRNYNNQYFFLIKQILGIVVGFVFMIFFSKFNYNKLSKFSIIFVIFTFILLALVFIPGIGVENYGARRWVRLVGFTIQPSELAKFAFVLFSSTFLAKNHEKIKKFSTILPVLLVGCGYCLMIILEPNMSITMCMGLIMLFMLFVGGVSFKHFLLLCIPFALLIPILIIIEPYRLLRLLAFINPWSSPKGEGYQLIQSFFAISNGGLFGVGLFNSRQKYLFLPFAESDFIFSIICEEFGFVGATILILLFVLLIIFGIKVALNAKNRFGCYLASGIVSVIAIQTFLNVAVVTGSIPPTGLPLPFISSGSTSIVVFMSAMGVLLNIDYESKQKGASFQEFTLKFKKK